MFYVLSLYVLEFFFYFYVSKQTIFLCSKQLIAFKSVRNIQNIHRIIYYSYRNKFSEMQKYSP